VIVEPKNTNRGGEVTQEVPENSENNEGGKEDVISDEVVSSNEVVKRS